MNRERAIAQAEITRQRAEDRLEKLLNLPEEPTTDDPDGALVIWFRKRFRTGSRHYTYAAVRAGDGLWYTTGPQAPKGYSWEALVDWIDTDTIIWQASGWEPVNETIPLVGEHMATEDFDDDGEVIYE